MLRFAPSPTGDMHIGNLRAAIFNFIIAKQKGEKFLIRIEDTDSARNIEGADKEILALLNLFGLFWDKLVYQSENFPLHRKLAQNLIEKNKAFYCYATKDFLDKKREEASSQKRAFRYKDEWAEACKNENTNPAIRLCGDLGAESIAFFDAIKGECKFSQNELDSFVILREDTIPTYNFACAVDDMIYDISFIIRGEDHTSNTPKQMLIHRALGYDKTIKYAHLPIILNDEGKKMSKRQSESSVKWLLSQGFLPRAIVNYLLLMGNNPPCEIFSLNEAISWFDLSQLSKSPVRFDINQLRHINREHLKRLGADEMGLLLIESNEKLKQVVGNSASCGDFLGSASACFVNEPTSSISSLASHNPKNSSTILECASCVESMKNTESNADSAESQNLGENQTKNAESTLDSANSQNLVKNQSREAQPLASSGEGEGVVREGEGSDFAIQAPAPSLKENARGKKWESKADLSAKSCQENRDSFLDSSVVSLPQNDNLDAESALDSANRVKFTNSLGALGLIFLEEASTLNELNDKLNHIFAPKDLENFEFGENARILKAEILRLAQSSAESSALNDFESLKSALSSKVSFKGKAFFMPLRFLLTGAQKGPHLDTLYPHLRAFLAQILKD